MLCEEPKLASFCLTELDAGSDVAGMKTRAVKKGDKYVINGSKCFITNGALRDWFTVYAKTDPDAGSRGHHRPRGRQAGRHHRRQEGRQDGSAGLEHRDLTFDDVEVPAENMLGEENKAFKLAMMTLDRTRPGVAPWQPASPARLDAAVQYSKERQQFGVPIAMHQAIQFLIADMAVKVDAARLLTWQSASQLDNGERNTLTSSEAKRFAADSAMEVTTDAVQVFGGYGFIRSTTSRSSCVTPRLCSSTEGTSQIQRMVIAREVLLLAPCSQGDIFVTRRARQTPGPSLEVLGLTERPEISRVLGYGMEPLLPLPVSPSPPRVRSSRPSASNVSTAKARRRCAPRRGGRGPRKGPFHFHHGPSGSGKSTLMHIPPASTSPPRARSRSKGPTSPGSG